MKLLKRDNNGKSSFKKGKYYAVSVPLRVICITKANIISKGETPYSPFLIPRIRSCPQVHCMSLWSFFTLSTFGELRWFVVKLEIVTKGSKIPGSERQTIYYGEEHPEPRRFLTPVSQRAMWGRQGAHPRGGNLTWRSWTLMGLSQAQSLFLALER